MDIKKRDFIIFYFMLFVYTLLAVVSYYNQIFQMFMFAIIVVAPLVCSKTKTIGLYFYCACFMGCLGSGGFLTVLNISLFLFELKIIIKSIKEKKFNNIKTIIFAWVILLAILTVYSLIYNKFKVYRIAMFIDFIQCFLILFLVKKEIDIKYILLTLFAGIVSSVVTSGLYIVLNDYNTTIAYDGVRFGAYFRNINTLAVYCTVCASSFIVLLLNNQLEYKKYVYFPIITSLIGLLTYSKAFILVNVVLYLTWTIMMFIRSKNKKKFSLYLLFVLIGLMLVAVLARNYILNLFIRFISTGHTNIIDNLTTGRAEIWSKYIDNWLKSPLTFLFGNGYSSEKIKIIEAGLLVYKYEHSIYLAFLNQFGIVGSAAIIYLIVKTLKTNGKLQRNFSCYIPLGLLLINGISSNLSGVLCSCLIWFMAFYFTTYSAETPVQEEKKIETNKVAQNSAVIKN